MREAYRFLSRAIHPDRFDPTRHEKDWRLANSRMSAINEAYNVLQDPVKRKSYDEVLFKHAAAINKDAAENARQTKEKAARSKSSASKSHRLENLTPGTAIFGELPRKVQDILRRRQANICQDQMRIPLHSIDWNYFFFVLFTGYFVASFCGAFGWLWPSNLLFFTAGGALMAGILLGRNIVTLFKWHKSVLKPFFYLTPIYLIKTEYNNIVFLPLWKLQNEDVRHRYFHGVYCGTKVRLRVDGAEESLTFRSFAEWERFCQQLLVYKERLRAELLDNNHEYLQEHDDFRGMQRHPGLRKVRFKRSKSCVIYVMATALSGILWSAIALFNIISNQ